jgi:hypothetical protein
VVEVPSGRTARKSGFVNVNRDRGVRWGGSTEVEPPSRSQPLANLRPKASVGSRLLSRNHRLWPEDPTQWSSESGFCGRQARPFSLAAVGKRIHGSSLNPVRLSSAHLGPHKCGSRQTFGRRTSVSLERPSAIHPPSEFFSGIDRSQLLRRPRNQTSYSRRLSGESFRIAFLSWTLSLAAGFHPRFVPPPPFLTTLTGYPSSGFPTCFSRRRSWGLGCWWNDRLESCRMSRPGSFDPPGPGCFVEPARDKIRRSGSAPVPFLASQERRNDATP